jgi:tripartite-type tricarboxylate transporter receptor subunit TctC
MNLNANRIGLLLAATASALATGAAAQEGPFPNKPLRVVVPYTAGGNADVATRTVMKELSARLGQPIVIDNKPGGNSMLGTDLVAKAPADGYTLGVVVGAYSINPALYKKMPYSQADFTPVTIFGHTHLVLVTGNPAIKTFPDFVRDGAANDLTYATTGVGSNSHLLSTRLAKATGMKSATNVPYKGAPDMVADLTANRVSFTFDTLAGMGPQIQANRLNALAVTSTKRSALLPNIPTIVELGYPDLVSYSWLALLAPAKTPAAIVAKLQAEVAAALNSAEVKTRFASMATDPVGSTPAEAAAFIAAETKVNGDVIRQLGITLD